MEFIDTQIAGKYNLTQVKEWEGVFHGFGDATLNIPVAGDLIDTSAWNDFSTVLRLLVLKQEHGKKIVSLIQPPTDEEIEKLISDPPTADAWICSTKVLEEKKLVCGIRSADCFPILIKSKTTDLAAVVHCGWKGTQSGLILDVITQMARAGSPQRELEVCMGPGAQVGAYEIQSDVASKLEMAYEFVNFPTATDIPEPTQKRDGKIYAALTNLLSAQAVFAGVPKKSILLSPDCTITNERYFSFRRQKEEAGRQLSFVGPKK